MRFGGVPEFGDKRVLFECLLDDSSLNAFAASMDQPNFAQAGGMCLVDVFLDNRRDVARGERVQIEMIFDGDAVSHRVMPTSVVDTPP